MTRLEIITELCEIAAKLSELSEQAQDSDVKLGITSVESNLQMTLRKLQGES